MNRIPRMELSVLLFHHGSSQRIAEALEVEREVFGFEGWRRHDQY